jgi:hypothetical protein
MGPSSPPLERQPLTGDHDQVISLPTYAGRYNLGAYLDWECEVDHTFGYHDFREYEIVSTVPQTFTDFASS